MADQFCAQYQEMIPSKAILSQVFVKALAQWIMHPAQINAIPYTLMIILQVFYCQFMGFPLKMIIFKMLTF